MLRRAALRDDVAGLGLAGDGTLDRHLHGFVVELLDFGVVIGLPVDEHADRNEEKPIRMFSIYFFRCSMMDI